MALRFAIIITLEDKLCSGYEIAQNFNRGLGYFWCASHQQIYLELKKMTDAGLVSYDVIKQVGKPAKKVYRTTTEGFNALDDWLLLPAKMTPVKDALLMKIYVGSRVNPTVLLTEVQRHQQHYRELLKTYQEIDGCFQPIKEKPTKYQYSYLTLRKGILQAEAWLVWSDEVCTFLNDQIKDSF